jgi:hypothetical protein
MTIIKQEWPPLFLEFIKYLRINSKEVAAIDSRGAPFELWESQRLILDTIIKGMEQGAHTFMFGKARQLGCSTFFEALDIFWLATHPGMMGAYVIDKEKNIPGIRDKIKRYFNSFPPGFFGSRFQVENDNKDFLLFSNGSRLDFLTAGIGKKETHWGEGKGYSLAHLTECSKYGSPESLASFRETLAETNPDRLFVYESTSNGLNHWKEMWSEFGRDEFGKRRMFLGWWSKDINIIKKNDPRYKVYGVAEPDPIEEELIEKVEKDYGYKVTREQLAWYRYKDSDSTVTRETMRQNLPWTIEESFVATGYSFFQMPMLQREMERVCELEYLGYTYLIGNDFWAVVCEQITDPNRVEDVVLRVWDEPDPDGSYVIACDPAWGRDENKDRHAISVFRCFGDKLVQVAEYADNAIDTRQAAWVLAHLAGVYRNCVVNVEINGPGAVVITELENLRERVRTEPRFENKENKNDNWYDFLDSARWYLYRKPDHWSASGVKCWETNSKNKAQIMHGLRDKYVTDQIVIRSKPLVEEMMCVIMNGDSIEAPPPAHDDRVFALALGCRTWVDDYMMPLLSRGEMYQDYIAAINGEPVDKSVKFVNNIVRDFLKSQEERAQMPVIPPHKQWLYDKGFI